jgi:16S rRNA pseudouridine516 synthase
MSVERLDKILSNSGFGTRKEVKDMVKRGRVLVNGLAIKDSAVHADPEKDEITIDGEKLLYRKYIYIMMNKPQGVISATEDYFDKTVIDLLAPLFQSFNPAPVGRLDKDTEGLLLITNDGELNHSLLSPKKHVSKKYYAKVDGFVTEDDIKKFEEGVYIEEGYRTMPSELKILSPGETSEIELIIYEGKFHQVKRMFEAVDKKVIYLKRLEMGSLKLDEALQPGESRELTDEELKMLVNNEV